MFEDRLREQLRKDLEAPMLSTPHPAQARFGRVGAATSHPTAAVLRVGGAFAVGAIVTAAVLSAETGSTNPRVWSVRVASALTELTETAPPTQIPNAPTPTGSGDRGTDSNGAAPEPRPTSHDDGPSESGTTEDHGQGGSPSGATDDPTPAPVPNPTATANEHVSDGSGGSSGGSDGDGSSAPTPTPTESSEPRH